MTNDSDHKNKPIYIKGFLITEHFKERWIERAKGTRTDLEYALENAKRIKKCKINTYPSISRSAHSRMGYKVRYYLFERFIFIKRGKVFVTCLHAFRSSRNI